MKKLPTTEEAFERYLFNFVKKYLRRASVAWPYRNAALRAARVSRGLYKCAICERSDLKKGQYHLDHVHPVAPTYNKNYSIETYIRRLFVKTKGWQVLCIMCHSLKTELENAKR